MSFCVCLRRRRENWFPPRSPLSCSLRSADEMSQSGIQTSPPTRILLASSRKLSLLSDKKNLDGKKKSRQQQRSSTRSNKSCRRKPTSVGNAGWKNGGEKNSKVSGKKKNGVKSEELPTLSVAKNCLLVGGKTVQDEARKNRSQVRVTTDSLGGHELLAVQNTVPGDVRPKTSIQKCSFSSSCRA